MNDTICQCGKEKGWDEKKCPACLETRKEGEIMSTDKERRDKGDPRFSNPSSEVTVKPGSSPAEMIQAAVAGGLDPEYLKELLVVQKDWEANEARKAYHVAMAAFKENPPKIEKDKRVGYEAKGGKVGYSHASLANVVNKITIELSKHGFSASWSTQQNGAVVVTCSITHSLGHSEQTTLSAPSDTTGSKNAIQAIGSTITYLQRYTLLSALGLATSDVDDDGKGSEIEYIGDKEMHIIRDLLISVDAKEGPLLKYLSIEKLEDMPMSDYQKALTVIEAKKNENNNG